MAQGQKIYHIADRQAWEQAQSLGIYQHRTLETEGFIHCSTANQVIEVANENFRWQSNLLLLEIAEARLNAVVRYENLENGENLYPHIYGPINCDAVVAIHAFLPLPTGDFVLPTTIMLHVENKRRNS